MVRSDGVCTNSTGDDESPDFEAVFQELERWHEALKDHPNILRGPRL